MRRRSIYHVSWRTAAAALGALAAQLGIYGCGRFLIEKRPPSDGECRDVNPLDRTAIGLNSGAASAGSIAATAVATAAPIVIDWLDVGGDVATWLEDMLVYDEAMAANGLLNTVVKHATERPLPLVYARQGEDLVRRPNGYRSFYSGHTSAAATAVAVGAMTIGLRHGAWAWAWIAAAALTAAVAVGRVFAGRHFATDVIVGGLAGAGTAVGISLLHRR